MFGYFDTVLRPLDLILPKTSEYANTFKVKDRDKDKNNKRMFFCKYNDMLIVNYKTILAKIEDSKNIELNLFPVYDDRYIKTKTRTYDGKVYTTFRDINVPEENVQCESFIIISIDSLRVYKIKYHLQVNLDNFAYNIVDKQMTDYLDGNLFETDKG